MYKHPDIGSSCYDIDGHFRGECSHSIHSSHPNSMSGTIPRENSSPKGVAFCLSCLWSSPTAALARCPCMDVPDMRRTRPPQGHSNGTIWPNSMTNPHMQMLILLPLKTLQRKSCSKCIAMDSIFHC